MSFGISIGDILSCTRLAVSVYSSMKDAPEEFEDLRLDVLSLNTTLRALSEDASSPTSLIHLATSERQESLRVLLDNCSQGLARLQLLMKKYPSLSPGEKVRFLEHVRFASRSKRGPREKLAIHTASINIFLTSLTHSSLGRLEVLIKNVLGGSTQGDTGIKKVSGPAAPDPVWTSLAQSLALEGISESKVKQFKPEIVAYIRHLVSGGEPFWMKRASDLSLHEKTAPPAYSEVTRNESAASKFVFVQNEGTGNVLFSPLILTDSSQIGEVWEEYHNISAMPTYQAFSPEELRVADYARGRKTGRMTLPYNVGTGFGGFVQASGASSLFGSSSSTTSSFFNQQKPSFGSPISGSSSFGGSNTIRSDTGSLASSPYTLNPPTFGSGFGNPQATPSLFGPPPESKELKEVVDLFDNLFEDGDEEPPGVAASSPFPTTPFSLPGAGATPLTSLSRETHAIPGATQWSPSLRQGQARRTFAISSSNTSQPPTLRPSLQSPEPGSPSQTLSSAPPALLVPTIPPVPPPITPSTSPADRIACLQKAKSSLLAALGLCNTAKGSPNQHLINQLIQETIPSLVGYLRDAGYIVVHCDSCRFPILDAHYHCGVCAGGDWDVCERCWVAGVRCQAGELGKGHVLTKRSVGEWAGERDWAKIRPS